MRRLTPGDVQRRLAMIEQSPRSRKYRRKAKAHLLRDVKAEQAPGKGNITIPTGTVCGKRRFPTFSTAMEALIEAWHSPNQNRKEERVYPCKFCNGWHLTSRPERIIHNGNEQRETSEGDRHSGQQRQGQGQGDCHPAQGQPRG